MCGLTLHCIMFIDYRIVTINTVQCHMYVSFKHGKYVMVTRKSTSFRGRWGWALFCSYDQARSQVLHSAPACAAKNGRWVSNIHLYWTLPVMKWAIGIFFLILSSSKETVFWKFTITGGISYSACFISLGHCKICVCKFVFACFC